MADLYGASPSQSPEPEEISFTFLHQLLQHGNHPSSASSSAKFTHQDFPSLHPPSAAVEMLDPTRFGKSDMECVNFSDPGGYFAQGSAEKRKAAISVENNDLGDASCDDSENGAEEVSDVPSNSGKSRSSSKRSRAAEVHNLSEKRRRSRINEKMKALQNLIPNSNKTDKASMLDEAIEYLKQLQLQVQMLTMRNGLSLHPMCLPGVLQPMHLPLTGMGFEEGTGLLDTNSVPGTFSANAGSSVQTGLLNVPSQCAISGQPIVAHPGTNVVPTETSFSYEPAVPHGSFSLSKEICRESTQQGQLDTNQSVKTSSGVS